jgi:hypothetical protein
LNPITRENEDNKVKSHNQCAVTKCNIYNTLRNSSDAYKTTKEENTHTELLYYDEFLEAI